MFLPGELTDQELIQLGFLLTQCQQIRFTGRDLGLTNRQISNWNKEGLFIEPLEEGKHKQFDFVESIWILLAIELQDYGFSFEEIKHYKKTLCHSDILELVDMIDCGKLSKDDPRFLNAIALSEGKKLNFNEFFTEESLKIYRDIREKDPHTLLNIFSHVLISVFKKETYRMAFAHGGYVHFDWEFSMELSANTPYQETISSDRKVWDYVMATSGMVISLDYLLSSLILTEPKYKKNPRPMNLLLTKSEREIIEALRDHEDCKSIEVHFENQKPVRMVVTETIPYAKLLTQLTTMIRKNTFGEISVKYNNGNLVLATRKTSIRFNEANQ